MADIDSLSCFPFFREIYRNSTLTWPPDCPANGDQFSALTSGDGDAVSSNPAFAIIPLLMKPVDDPIERLHDPFVSHKEFVSKRIFGVSLNPSHEFRGDDRTTSEASSLSRALAIKYLFDKIAAFIGLFLLSPLLFCIAVAIRLDSPGSILFVQARRRQNREIFWIYKFRTLAKDDQHIKQVVEGDDRVTRVGRFLRRNNLDELPQLLNVLKGEMSLIGPRPHAVAHDDYYGQHISIYNERFLVRPGITGWAQVNGCRGPTPELKDMLKRVEHDLFYIENWSNTLDLSILFRTVAMQFLGDRNAL